MIKEVVSIAMPIDEKFTILKNRIMPDNAVNTGKRICIVTGTHGDELEGQLTCYELIRHINEKKQCLKGIVDVYPCLNPLGMDSLTRGVPIFDLDMNRVFPGMKDGHMVEIAANRIIEDIKGADMCIDIHASNIFLREIPQARVSEITAEKLVPYAKLLNLDFIWVHSAATVLESTLAHSLNMADVPTIVVEMGVGMRITKEYTNQLIKGIFNVMIELGIWDEERPDVKKPIISTDGEVSFVNSEGNGIFVPCVEHWEAVKKGEHLGDIVSPLTGLIEHRVVSPSDGMVFTLREYPIVSYGSLIARVLGGKNV